MILIIAVLCGPLLLLHQSIISEACIFKQFFPHSPADGVWDDETHARKTTAGCQCGSGGPLSEDTDKPWHVYIHSKVDPSNSSSSITCSGTIITSNLIVTSHECLTLEHKMINVYDALKPANDGGLVHTVNKSEIDISEKLNKSGGGGDIFKIDEIIYNPIFALGSSISLFPKNDFALIKLKGVDFTKHDTLKPICVPNYSSDLDFIHRPVYYYGAGVMGDQNHPIREIRDNNNTLKVRTGKECDEELDTLHPDMPGDRTYCLNYVEGGSSLTPDFPGGPLVTDTVGGRTFLIGIATAELGHSGPNGIYTYDYFSSIVPVIKYLEYQAARAGSLWCDSPPLNLKPKLPSRPTASHKGPWPWDNLKTAQRNESLDCDCGFASNDSLLASGRVAGGEVATPYEFGWMALIHIYHDGKGEGAGSNVCGGSIINDRMILTAAHCILGFEKIERNTKRLHVLPENVEVRINVHWSRSKDQKAIEVKVAAVLFHPEFVEAFKKNYFDYDIGLLVLAEPLTFSPPGSYGGGGIQPICLPKLGDPDVIKENGWPPLSATVAGWGLLDPDNPRNLSDPLQKIEVPILGLDECQKYNPDITDRFICAGYLHKQTDSAAGDSGQDYQTSYFGIVVGTQTISLYSHVQRVCFLAYWTKSGIIVLVMWHISDSEACIFKQFFPQSSPDGVWDDESHARRHTDCRCGSGSYSEDMDKPWHVYIHSKVGPSSIITCSGTIITSNLIVTSHGCLTLEGGRINVYDAWTKPANNGGAVHTVDKSDLVISAKLNKSRGETFKIDEIIYNPNFALGSSLPKTFPKNDFVLIKVKGVDFTKHDTSLYPICVPSPNSPDLDFIHRPAYYYGAGVMSVLGQDPFPVREIRDDTLKVRTGDECDEDLDSYQQGLAGNNRTLCINYVGGFDLIPEFPGGPLVTDTQSGNNGSGGRGGGGGGRTFLIGIATEVGHLGPNGIYQYDYFSSIVPVIKYLEYEAARHGSYWCDSPPLHLKPKIPPGPRGEYQGPWPWDNLAPVQRNESLNCVCGMENTFDVVSSGRVAGGVNATPYEFGWMALIHIYHNGKGVDAGVNLCGGTIINDRLILTAAHCIVADDKILQSNLERVHVTPDNVHVTINVHWSRGKDAKGIEVKLAGVLFHPDYAEAYKGNDFDYDIALLVLSEPLKFSPPGSRGRGIRPICLPKMGEPNVVDEDDWPPNTATVAGWGLLNPEDPLSTSDTLQKIEVPILGLDKCRKYNPNIPDRFICAGHLNKHLDSAAGDSGGPLMVIKKNAGTNKQWIQVGIVSWGQDHPTWHGYGPTRTISLYTRVQMLLPYVDYHAKRLNANWCRTS